MVCTESLLLLYLGSNLLICLIMDPQIEFLSHVANIVVIGFVVFSCVWHLDILSHNCSPFYEIVIVFSDGKTFALYCVLEHILKLILEDRGLEWFSFS